MADIVIQTGEAPNPETIEGEVEAIAEAELEAVETVSDNEVTIAAIEAEKEIAIATIHADARVAEAEALSNIEPAQDNDLWTTLNLLSSQVAEIQVQIAALTIVGAMDPPHSSLEAEAVEAAMLTAAESDSTPSDTLPETSSMQTEPIESEGGASPVVVIPPVLEVAGKPVIKLI